MSSIRTLSWSIATWQAAERAGAPIVAVFETHVQADHVSGLPALVEATGATRLPAGWRRGRVHHTPLADGEVVELGNTVVRALATPGHAPGHHAYFVADRRRDDEEPWLVFTGDSLLVGDVGRPDLHAGRDPEPLARELFALDPPAAGAARPRARLSEPLRRLGLRPGALREPVLLDRFRAAAQPGSAARRRRRASCGRFWSMCRRRRLARRRSSPPTGAGCSPTRA